jgi:hypothetical protein
LQGNGIYMGRLTNKINRMIAKKEIGSLLAEIESRRLLELEKLLLEQHVDVTADESNEDYVFPSDNEVEE